LQATTTTTPTTTTTRDANAVISIGKRCLYFLRHVSELYQIENFVSANGQIQGYERAVSIRINGKIITKMVLYHDCFPSPDSARRRLPISTTAIESLHKAVYKVSSDIFIRKRRYALLRALEITGGRRSEVCSLKVEDVYAALRSPEILLTINTLKRGKIVTRELPISKIDLNFLIEYIEVNRAWTIMNTCGDKNDSGYLFVNSRTGLKIESNTITQELSTLANAAGIVTPSCPHMFRHRYITKLLVALIEQHKISNKDSFLKYYQDIEKFKAKVKQYTGHKSIQSLDVYIHAAFEDVENYKKTVDVNRIADSIRALRVSFLRIAGEMRQEGLQGYPESLIEIIETFEEEVQTHQQQT
jgi:integrase